MFLAPIEPTGQGDYLLTLGGRERAVLRELPYQLERLLDEAPADPSLRRLSPPAYGDDAEAEAEYRRLMADELEAGRRSNLRTFAETLERERLTRQDLEAWLTALNDLRLVLGTRLDVTEELFDVEIEPSDPRGEELALYAYLSWLQEHVVRALDPD